jgi:hypothetical protein
MEIKVRLIDVNGNLIAPEISKYIDVNFSFDKEFEVLPSAFPSTPVSEYTISTEANNMNITASVGRITLFSYSGAIKDINITLTDDKINAIKVLTQ